MKKFKKILFLDLETTGHNPHTNDILAIGCAVWDKDLGLKEEDTFEVYLRSRDTQWVVTTDALKYNKYDLIKHEEIAIPFQKGMEAFVRFVEARMTFPIVCAGINIDFDLDFLNEVIKHPKGEFFSHYKIDLTSIIAFLYHQKCAPISSECTSLTKWALEFFGCSPQHDGPKSPLKDVLAMITLYERLLIYDWRIATLTCDQT